MRLPHRLAAAQHAALLRLSKARQQVENGGFAAAGGAEQHHKLPFGQAEVDIFQHRQRLKAQRDLLQRDMFAHASLPAQGTSQRCRPSSSRSSR